MSESGLGLWVYIVVACCSSFPLSFLTPLSKCEYTNNTRAGHSFPSRTLSSAGVGSLAATPSSHRGFNSVCLIGAFFRFASTFLLKGLWTVPWRPPLWWHSTSSMSAHATLLLMGATVTARRFSPENHPRKSSQASVVSPLTFFYSSFLWTFIRLTPKCTCPRSQNLASCRG